MNNEDYPALFQSTDEAAIYTQRFYIMINLCYLITIILATIFKLFIPQSNFFSISSAFLFLAGLFLLIIILTKKSENKWYTCRTIAESVKTATWRFMMRAEPYKDSNNLNKVKANFQKLLKNILEQNKEIADHIGGKRSANEQITEKILDVRKLPVNERKEFYIKNRIDDQREWYSNKYSYNKKCNMFWFILVITFNIVAVILAIIQINNPLNKYLPTDVFAVIAVSSLAWIQLKRYQELSSSFALAAHEIGTLKIMAEDVNTENDLSNFVINSENAFSREHTQWIAKRIT
jgi:hypothetical protein